MKKSLYSKIGELLASEYNFARVRQNLQQGSIRRENKLVMISRYKKTGKTSEFSGILPARLDVGQTADVLGFQEHDIAPLIKEALLEPLGKPMPNARKYFARVKIMEIADDPSWLSKATKAISQHWQDKNASRKPNGDENEISHTE